MLQMVAPRNAVVGVFLFAGRLWCLVSLWSYVVVSVWFSLLVVGIYDWHRSSGLWLLWSPMMLKLVAATVIVIIFLLPAELGVAVATPLLLLF